MNAFAVYATITIFVFLALFLCLFRPAKKEEEVVLTEDELFLQQYRERQMRGRKKKRSKSKEGKLTVMLLKMRALVKESKVSPLTIALMAAGGAVAAFVAGKVLFTNLIISLTAAIIGTSLPLFILSSRAAKAKTTMISQLESTMRLLTNAYMADGDFVRVVRNNVHQIEFAKPFKQFLLETDMIDPDIEKALRRMDLTVNNRYFTQWINLIILAQNDREMIRLLPSVCEAMNYNKTAQIKARTAMGMAWKDYFTMLIMVTAIPVVLRVALPDWYDAMVKSSVGVAVMMLVMLTIVISLIIAKRVDKPIDDL